MIMGVAWYSPEAWQQLAALPEARIQKSYDDFIRTFNNLTRDYTARGVQFQTFNINIDHMLKWCARHGYAPDAHGRAAYGAALQLAGDDAMSAKVIDNTRVLQ